MTYEKALAPCQVKVWRCAWLLAQHNPARLHNTHIDRPNLRRTHAVTLQHGAGPGDLDTERFDSHA